MAILRAYGEELLTRRCLRGIHGCSELQRSGVILRNKACEILRPQRELALIERFCGLVGLIEENGERDSYANDVYDSKSCGKPPLK